MGFPLKASSGGGSSEKAPPGNHLAVLVGIIDLGTQEHSYQGKTSWRRDVFLVWELVSKKIAGTTKNHLISAAVTLSLAEKATLRKWIESRRGKKIADGEAVELGDELGKGCLLNVVLSDKGYPRVDGVASIPDGLPEPKASYSPVAIDLDQFKSGAEIPDWVPWHYGSPVVDHIKGSRELGGAKPQPKSAQPTEEYGTSSKDPIPF
jgi:hypothetical protein